MLERFALPSALHQIAQWRQFRIIKRTLELEIKLHPRAPEDVREQVFRVQSRTVDLVLSEIRRRRLQDFEQCLRFCHVERSRSKPQKRVLTPKSTPLPTSPPSRPLVPPDTPPRVRHH